MNSSSNICASLAFKGFFVQIDGTWATSAKGHAVQRSKRIAAPYQAGYITKEILSTNPTSLDTAIPFVGTLRKERAVQPQDPEIARSLNVMHTYIVKIDIVYHHFGDVAQMVERALRMREVGGSMPPVSTKFFTFRLSFFGTVDWRAAVLNDVSWSSELLLY